MIKVSIHTTAAFCLLACLVTLNGDAANPASKSEPKIGKFTLVYNVNNGGYIDVCGCKHKKVRNGSLTRRASYLKQLRSTGRTLLMLDGGSALFSVNDQPRESEKRDVKRKAELIVEAYNRMGYRAMAIGVSDISLGLDTLEELLKSANFDAISANFCEAKTGEPIFKPYAIYTINGVRVGVVGLTLDTMGRAYLAKRAPGVEIKDPLQAARKVVAEIESKTDLIIALSHIRQEKNWELAAGLKSIGIVVDPYIEQQNARTWIKEEEWLSALDETLFLRSDGQGARLGVVDIEVDFSRAKLRHAALRAQLEEAVKNGTATPEQKQELAVYQKRNSYDFSRVSIGPHHREDPDIEKLVAEWKKGIKPSDAARFEGDLPMRKEYMTSSKCRSCHEAQYAFWKDTPHANAMAALEETGDEHRYDCVGCHSLGYGTAFLDTSKIGDWANVQCESCHGANAKHADDPRENPFKKIEEFTCLTCHNKEHTLKEFQFFSSRRKMQCPKG